MEPIKVKSYNFIAIDTLIFFSIIIAILYIFTFVLMLIGASGEFPTIDIIVASIVAGCVEIIIYSAVVICYFFCRTFDIYTDKNFIRVRKKKLSKKDRTNKVIYNIAWRDVKQIRYFRWHFDFLFGTIIPIFHRNVMTLELYKINEKPDITVVREGMDYDDLIIVKLSRKHFDRISKIIPLQIYCKSRKK